MQVHRAPASRERHLLARRDVLVAEENHAVIEQRAVHRFESPVVDAREIDAMDFSAHGAGERLHFEQTAVVHRFSSSLRGGVMTLR